VDLVVGTPAGVRVERAAGAGGSTWFGLSGFGDGVTFSVEITP
jgi:hypothetical protein